MALSSSCSFFVSVPDIMHHLGADHYAFDRPVEDILNGWSPTEPNDVLTPKRVHLVSGSPVLRPLLANVWVAGTDNQYEWSINTAPVWIAALSCDKGGQRLRQEVS
jgi:hypothetical protein